MMLSEEETKFVDEYLQTWDATEAARAAGYGDPEKQSANLLDDPAVKDAIRTRIQQFGIPSDWIYSLISEQARGLGIRHLNSEMQVDIVKLREQNQLHLFNRIEQMEDGTKIEFYDAVFALELIAFHLEYLEKQKEQPASKEN